MRPDAGVTDSVRIKERDLHRLTTTSDVGECVFLCRRRCHCRTTGSGPTTSDQALLNLSNSQPLFN